MTVKIFDPHVHFFDHRAGQYDWLKNFPLPAHLGQAPAANIETHAANIETHAANRKKHAATKQTSLFVRDNLELTDLIVEKPFELAGVAHIEAGFDNNHPSNEVKHWANMADVYSTPTTFISYLDITLPTAEIDAQLNAHQFPKVNNIKLRGFRCILDELSVDQVERALPLISKVLNEGFLFEWQAPIEDDQKTDLLLLLLNSAPDRRVVLNHIGSPSTMDTGDDRYEHFINNLRRVARFSNIHIKCSGFDRLPVSNTLKHLDRLLNDVVDIVDSDRLLMASNFPLLQLHPNAYLNTYNAYWHTIFKALRKMDAPIDNLMFLNASKLYTT